MAKDEIQSLRKEMEALKFELAKLNNQRGGGGLQSKCAVGLPSEPFLICGCTATATVKRPQIEYEMDKELTEMTAEIVIMHKQLMALAFTRNELDLQREHLRCRQKNPLCGPAAVSKPPCGPSVPKPPCGKPFITNTVCPPKPPPCAATSRNVECPPGALCGPKPPCQPPTVCPAAGGQEPPKEEAAQGDKKPPGKDKGKGGKGKGKGKGKKGGVFAVDCCPRAPPGMEKVPCPRGPTPCTCPDPCSGLKATQVQLNRLEDDFKAKLIEEAVLQTDIDRLKLETENSQEEANDAVNLAKQLQQKIDQILNEQAAGMDPKMYKIELEKQIQEMQQNNYYAQDETSMLQAHLKDIEIVTENYQTQYNCSMELVEKQKGEIQSLSDENTHLNENMEQEVQRVRNESNQKLDELSPLVDRLAIMQQDLAEEKIGNAKFQRELNDLIREKCTKSSELKMLENEIDKINQQEGSSEDQERKLNELEKKCASLNFDITEISMKYKNLNEEHEKKVKLLEERIHENLQLASQIEAIQNDTARTITKTKQMSDEAKKELQVAIGNLQELLTKSRAEARIANEERDAIRKTMQNQIFRMNENLDDAHMQIRVLQCHVNVLSSRMEPIECCSPIRPHPDCIAPSQS